MGRSACSYPAEGEKPVGLHPHPLQAFPCLLVKSRDRASGGESAWHGSIPRREGSGSAGVRRAGEDKRSERGEEAVPGAAADLLGQERTTQRNGEKPPFHERRGVFPRKGRVGTADSAPRFSWERTWSCRNACFVSAGACDRTTRVSGRHDFPWKEMEDPHPLLSAGRRKERVWDSCSPSLKRENH